MSDNQDVFNDRQISAEQRLVRAVAVVLAGFAGVTCLVFAEPVASASVNFEGMPSLMQKLPDDWQFLVSTLGFGGIAGWSVGYTLKKVAKALALLLGVVVIALQTLAFNQLITIDWQRIRQSVPENSLEHVWAGLMSVLAYNMPFAGAFAAGVITGFRSG